MEGAGRSAPGRGRLRFLQHAAKNRGIDLRRPLDRLLFHGLGNVTQLALQAAERLATDRWPRRDPPRRGRSRSPAGSRRSPWGSCGRCGPAGRCAASTPPGFQGQIETAPAGGRTGSSGPRRRPRWRAGATALPGGGTEPPRCSRRSGERILVEDAGPPARALDDVLEDVQGLAMGYEDERLLVRPHPARRLLGQPAARAGPDLRLPWRGRPSPSPPGSNPREGEPPRGEAAEHRSSLRRRATVFSAGWVAQVARNQAVQRGPQSAAVSSTGAGTRGGRPPMSTPPASSWCKAAAARAGPAARRRSPPRETPQGAGAGAGGRSRGRRPQRPRRRVSSSTCRPSAAIGATAR